MLLTADKFEKEGLKQEAKRLRVLSCFQKSITKKDIYVKYSNYASEIILKETNKKIGTIIIHGDRAHNRTFYPLLSGEYVTEHSKYFRLQSNAIEHLLERINGLR